MADLSSEFLGIKSPNPFWLASAPPTDKGYNVNRAFEAGFDAPKPARLRFKTPTWLGRNPKRPELDLLKAIGDVERTIRGLKRAIRLLTSHL